MLWSAIDTIVSDLTDSDSTSFPTATRLIYANQAQAEVSGDIMGADGNWNYDDTNYTDLPIATATLVNGQQDYSFDDEMLSVEGVSVMDSSGDYQKLKPFDKQELSVDPDEYLETNGLPTHYDKQGRSVFLYPAPATGSVTLSEGLKVFFKRKTKDITSFGAISPGFVSTEHMIIAYKIALPYVIKYKQDRVNLFELKIREHAERIKAHYSRRTKDEPSRMTPNVENNK
jgi:hypothetical protein